MDQFLRVGTIAVLFFAQTGSLKLQGQTVCPHSAARATKSFVSRERSEASSASANLYGDDSKSTWAYLDIGSSLIPTLMPDGRTLDYDHKNDIDMISYWKPNRSVDKSFLTRSFGREDILTAGSLLQNEGVDNLSAIISEVRTKRFALVKGELATKEHLKDIVWTNTIFVDQYNTPQSNNLYDFKRINEELFDSVRNSELRELVNDGIALATTVKTDSGEQLLTVFVPDQSAAAGHLVGYLHLLDSDPIQNEAAINAWFADMKPGTRVYICGHDVNVDFTKLAEQYNITVIRRGSNVSRNILQTDRTLKAISARGLKPESTSVLNGIPSTKAALESMNKPIGGVDGWNAFHTEIEQVISGHYSLRITTKQQLYEELINGQTDTLFLLAHFDGKALYFGEEKASFDEIAALKNRRSGGRPRTAVLFACNTGALSNEERSFFQKQVKSIGELFVQKGYFDQIIAPQHEIENNETMSTLKGYLKDTRVRQEKWVMLAENREMEDSHEVLQQP